jgi:hypothetical protein
VQSLHDISLGYSLFQVIDLTSYKVLQWWDPSKTKGDAEVNCDCIWWWNDWCLHWHVLYAGTFPMLPIHCHADWVLKRWFSSLLQTCAIWSFISARQYFSWSVFKVSFKDFVSCYSVQKYCMPRSDGCGACAVWCPIQLGQSSVSATIVYWLPTTCSTGNLLKTNIQFLSGNVLPVW